MKVLLDANILFSAALPGSKLSEMIQTLLRHSACVTNRHAREEAERNLQIKHPDRVTELRDMVTRMPIHEGLAELAAVEIRDKDKPVLAGAIHTGCSHFVTGDKRDFDHLFGRTVRGVRIVSPRTFADESVALGLADPIAKKLDLIAHLARCPRVEDAEHSSELFANGKPLLLADNNSGVIPADLQKRAV